MASMIEGSTVIAVAQSIGLYQCDRDFILRSATAAADSFEDLKANPTTFAEEHWNELSCVGVYKKDGNGIYVSCPEADIPADACLTVWDYVPRDNFGEPINIEIRGGHIRVAADLVGDPNAHRFYTIAAPNIPSFIAPGVGGTVRYFDGYLGRHAGETIASINPSAGGLNAGDSIEQGRLRFLLYYPKGNPAVTHLFRLITYRALGTFH